MKYLLYRGGATALDNAVYQIDIYKESDTIPTVTEFAFDASDSVVLQWDKKDKTDAIRSSSCTINIISDIDRRFFDLYTVKAASTRIDIYKDNVLYWSGTLDPELYEEPYSEKENYTVNLTFSDFAVLDRIKFDGTGFLSLEQIVTDCLEKSGISYRSINTTAITTRLRANDYTKIYTDVCVNSANFYDEDGEAFALYKVLEGVLKPLNISIIQRNGIIYLSDVNGLTEASTYNAVQQGTDATLSTDKVYNNVVVKFSPYDEKSIINQKIDGDSITPGQTVFILVDYSQSGGVFTSPKGFDIVLSDAVIPGIVKNSAARFFKINPVFSGGDATGIAWTVKKRGIDGRYTSYLNEPSATIGGELMKVEKLGYIPDVGSEKRENFYLQLKQELLFDVRYNPFEGASEPNEEGDWSRLQNWSNFAYIPFILTLRDSTGAAIYHFENKLVYEGSGYEHNATNFKWVAGEGKFGDAYLCYYDVNNRKSVSGLGGWQTNKPIIGYYRGGLPTLLQRMNTGEYMPLPDKAGWLEIKIGTGIIQFDYERKIKNIYDRTRWVLYKTPVLNVVDNNGQDIEAQDIEHSAWINKDAKEKLSVDTICGTIKEGSPLARGQYYKKSDKSIITSFYRAGVQDLVEKLLIGTIYSNYATRHNVVSGTFARINEYGKFRIAGQTDTFMLLGDVQNLFEATSNAEFIKISADNYEGIEYE